MRHSGTEDQSQDKAPGVGPARQRTGVKSVSQGSPTGCEHQHRRIFARNLCSGCYYRSSRSKKAWVCEHTNKVHYAKGLCQNCYLSCYYRDRKSNKNNLNRVQQIPQDDRNNISHPAGTGVELEDQIATSEQQEASQVARVPRT